MCSVVMALMACCLQADAAPYEPGLQLTFQGQVTRVADAAAATADKTFDLLIVITRVVDGDPTGYWIVNERGQGGFGWAERFGRLVVDREGRFAAQQGPALLYDYGDGRSVVPLPSPFWRREQPLTIDTVWNEGNLEYRVQRRQTMADADTARVAMNGPYGRRATYWVDSGVSLVVAAEERVFMNQGTEYQLRQRRIAAEPLNADTIARVDAAFSTLWSLREQLKRPLQSQQPGLSAKQLEVALKALPQLVEAHGDTPLADRLLRDALEDVQTQARRNGAVDELATQRLGQPLPEFTAETLSGKPFDSADLAGNISVLHFWDYRGEPLEEPYGQVGYLEFLYNRHKDAGLRVYGIAVDNRLARPDSRRPALASIRKLRQFMNLSYPILLDDGKILRKMGDPRLAGADLPLVVVVDGRGNVLHYHVGHYAVDRRDGLKALDAVIVEAIAAQPQAADQE